MQRAGKVHFPICDPLRKPAQIKGSAMNLLQRSIVLASALLWLAACSPHDEKLRAVAEVEKHCGLPPNSLNRNFVDDRFDISDEMNTSKVARIKKTVSLGNTVTDRRVIDKRDCIANYKSSGGFVFVFHVANPASVPAR